MKKLYITGCMLAIILGLYSAHLHGMEEFIPMPDYVESTVVSQEVGPRTVNQLTSKGTDQVITYEGEPRRIMGVWQSSVETLLALGVGDRMIAAIGVPDSKYIAEEYRDAYEKIPYKSMEIPDVETTLLWEPDLLVGWYSTFQKNNWKSTDFWAQRGIDSYISRASYKKSKRTVEGEYQYILDLGAIVNRQERAEMLVNRTKRAVAEARAYGEAQHTKDTVLILENSGRQYRVYDKETLAGNMLEEIGGHLISEAGQTINAEELIHLNPSVIFLVLVEEDYERQDELINNLYKNPTLQHVDAIRNHRVHGVPLFMVYSAGTRIHDGLNLMIHGLYPNFTGGIHE